MILKAVLLLSVINQEIITAVPGYGLLQQLYHILILGVYVAGIKYLFIIN